MFEIDGIDSAIAKMESFNRVLKNRTNDLLERGMHNFEETVDKSFESEAFRREGWLTLSEKQIKKRRESGVALGDDHPILQFTGQLRSVATNIGTSAQGVKSYYTIDGDSLEMTIEGAKVANAVSQDRKLPLRPFWADRKGNMEVGSIEDFTEPFKLFIDLWVKTEY